MKVILAGYQAVSILHGGPSTQIKQTARHLPRYGVGVEFFDPWKTLRKGDCDIVHIFAANIGTYHLAREIHALGIPLVVSPIIYSRHTPQFVRRALKISRFIQRYARGVWSDYSIAADICGWADRVLPNTNAEAELIVSGFDLSNPKITVIPNGVDERFYTADPTSFVQKYGVKDFILNVGHTGHERKNVLSLIRALAGIGRPAVIIGRFIAGSYGDACRAEAAKNKKILLIDGLDNASEMLASAYAACDTFVLPSQFETPGIAALEAGLAGAKVVITPHGGTREYFGEHAWYVEPGSVASIRDGILAALKAEKTHALREHIRKSYMWQKVAEATAACYKLVAGRSQ
ncbi:MAG: glycosyltransferase family 4 protein [Bacteroidota bacterium]